MNEWTTLVTANELAGAIGAAGLVVVDCRFSLADKAQGRREWLQSHVPGAVHADLERDLSAAPAPGLGRHPLPRSRDLCASLGRWGIAPNSQVVAYDAEDGSMAASRLWWLLRLLGHRRLAVLDGGLRAWRDAELPLQAGEVDTIPADYPDPGYRADELIDAATLRARLESAAVCLVDARAAPRFRGEHEPIDAVAGHIPGARNRPYSENLSEGGRFKPPARLGEEWRRLIAPHPPSGVVLMCGSGVTACHHRLAMAHAGLEGARLFAPSWSGWIDDPAHPVATGA
jgi:thiosulfate/3-mercaptopyruvate sulfurtransferase